jgi:hypothetical protein
MLVLDPANQRGYAAFVNAADGFTAHAKLQEALIGEHGPLTAPRADVSSSTGLRADPVGIYTRAARRVVVTPATEGTYDVEVEPIPADFADGEVYLTSSVTRFRARPAGDDRLVSVDPVFGGLPYVLTFLEPECRHYDLLYMENRLARREEPAVGATQ